MLALFGRSAEEMIGKTFAELDYPPDLAERLNGHIDRIFQDGEVDPMTVIRWKDILEALEDAIDAAETAADVVGNIVVKNR